jgi:4-diphosphocytidyl-2-C-methyl-D-erythritol kinase
MMIKSYAKINLFLEITGKEGGFHKLHSLFLKIDLHDDISVVRSDTLKAVYSGTAVENDIVLKVGRILAEYFPHVDTAFEFRITKRIPIGGGLGGASSNAASVLKLLLNENNIILSQQMLFEIAGKIGADVPFFLCDGAMILNGVGMELSRPEFEVPNLYFALNFPKYSSITKDVFAKIKPPYTKYRPVISFEDCLLRGNDMYNAANELSGGLIASGLESLNHEKALVVRMSGSGATCFAVFDDDRYFEKYSSGVVVAKSI